MLILSRKLNEQIVIGDQIVVTVVAIRGGNARLGIEAPENVPVHRQEVYDILREKNEGLPLTQNGRDGAESGQSGGTGGLENSVGQASTSSQTSEPNQPDLYPDFVTHIINGRFNEARDLLSYNTRNESTGRNVS